VTSDPDARATAYPARAKPEVGSVVSRAATCGSTGMKDLLTSSSVAEEERTDAVLHPSGEYNSRAQR
jgi:hypothetical protein